MSVRFMGTGRRRTLLAQLSYIVKHEVWTNTITRNSRPPEADIEPASAWADTAVTINKELGPRLSEDDRCDGRLPLKDIL